MKLRKVKGSGLDKSDVYVLYKKDLILQTTWMKIRQEPKTPALKQQED
jgi:hypothetical protein